MIEYKKKAYDYWMAFGFIVVGICFLFTMFGKPNTVHNDSPGTVRVGEGLEQARGNQQLIEERINNAAERIDGIAGRIESSQGRIGNAQNRVGTIESLVSEAEGIARTDRAILQKVKERAEAGIGGEGK